MSLTKRCIECDADKPVSDFYIAHRRTHGVIETITYTTLCRTHSNAKRKSNYKNQPKNYKTKGFLKLDEDIRKKILVDINDKLNFKKISKKYDISYGCLMSWKRSNQFK